MVNFLSAGSGLEAAEAATETTAIAAATVTSHAASVVRTVAIVIGRMVVRPAIAIRSDA